MAVEVLTLTTDTARLAVLQAAVGEVLDLKNGGGAVRSATPGEVKQYIIDHCKSLSVQYQQRKAAREAQVNAFDAT